MARSSRPTRIFVLLFALIGVVIGTFMVMARDNNSSTMHKPDYSEFLGIKYQLPDGWRVIEERHLDTRSSETAGDLAERAPGLVGSQPFSELTLMLSGPENQVAGLYATSRTTPPGTLAPSDLGAAPMIFPLGYERIDDGIYPLDAEGGKKRLLTAREDGLRFLKTSSGEEVALVSVQGTRDGKTHAVAGINLSNSEFSGATIYCIDPAGFDAEVTCIQRLVSSMTL